MVEHTVVDTRLESLLDTRISTRAYEDRQVPREVIEEILRLAQKTPSWCNTQPWQVAVTEGEGTERFREALGAYVISHPQEPDFEFPREYQGIYKTRRFDCAMALYQSVGIAHGDRAASGAQTMKNFQLFGAPHVAIISTDEALGTYGAVDCGLYVNTFLLAAQSLGVATIPQAALAGSSPFLHEHFGIDESRKIVCAISFGYPDLDHPVNQFRTTRESVDAVVQWMSN